MRKIKIFGVDGLEKGDHVVPESVLVPGRFSSHVIFEAVNIENQNKRQGTHKTKNKSEVSGTGKKPYRQKHTGRARQGSRRNPHFRGGGIAFGVSSNRNYCVKVNKKVSRIALVSVWHEILSKGGIFLLDSDFVGMKISSKDFYDFLKKLGHFGKKVLVVSKYEEREIFLSFRNLFNVVVKDPGSCSVRDLLNQEFCFFTTRSMEDFYLRMSIWK